MTDRNIYETLSDTARRLPEHLAIADEFGDMTYQRLWQEVEGLREELARSGCGNGHGVALITRNNRYFVIGLYAALGCGCVVMPLPYFQKPGELSHAIEESNIHFILSADKLRIEQHTEHQLANTNLFLSKTPRELNRPTVPDLSGAAVMRYTSGTTGLAKCVILSHRSIKERIEAANEGLKLTSDDRIVWVLPMAYHFIVSIMLYIRYGCGMIICSDFLGENIINQANQYRGTFIYASPMHIKLLASLGERYKLETVKTVVSTTTAISAVVCKQFEQRYRMSVIQAFGIIEVGLPIINLSQSQEFPESIGKALPAYTVAILDETFNELPDGILGQLAIKGPGMFDAYLQPATRREEVLKHGWFLTGDLAIRNSNDTIEIKGRSKNVINVSGNKVFPNEVEDVINQYPGVTLSKVYGQKHILMGELVVADVVLVTKDGFDSEELIDHCRRFLSSFKVPQRINVVDSIEHTTSGKIKRHE